MDDDAVAVWQYHDGQWSLTPDYADWDADNPSAGWHPAYSWGTPDKGDVPFLTLYLVPGHEYRAEVKLDGIGITHVLLPAFPDAMEFLARFAPIAGGPVTNLAEEDSAKRARAFMGQP